MASNAPTMNQEEIDNLLAQGTALKDAGVQKVEEGDLHKGLQLQQMALDLVIKAVGEVGFPAAPFYYAIGDTLLTKIETTQEVFSADEAQKKLPAGMDPEEMMRKAMEAAMGGAKPEAAKEETEPVEKKEAPIAPLEGSETQETKAEAPAEKPEAPEPKIEDEEEEKVDTSDPVPIQDPQDEEPSDQFQDCWEMLAVAQSVFNKGREAAEDKAAFSKTHWSLEADIIERFADLEAQRENVEEACKLYHELFELCVANGLNPETSRTVSSIYYKMGNARSLKEEDLESSIGLYEKSSKVLAANIKATLPEGELPDLLDLNVLKDIKLHTDESVTVKEILVDVLQKIEDTKTGLADAKKVKKMKESTKDAHTFKKPTMGEAQVINLGTFGSAATKRTSAEAGLAPVENPNGKTTKTDE